MTTPRRRPTRAELAALARRDPVLGKCMRDLPPFPGFPESTARRSSHYEELARAIVFQQLHGKAAQTIFDRIRALGTDGEFPAAAELLTLSPPALRACGLSGAKLAALVDLAERSADGRLELGRVARWSDERIVEHLIQVRGIGEWSAQMFLLFRLGRLDVAAPGDLAVREGLRLLDGLEERPTPRAALERSECWRPLRSVGTWWMWRLVERQRALERGGG